MRGVATENSFKEHYQEELTSYETALKSIIQRYEILGIAGEGDKGDKVEMINPNLTDDERQKIIEELKDFHKELKSYGRLLDPDRQLTEAQKRYRDSLREKLQRKIGKLKDTITQLTGKQYYTQFGVTHEIWAEGLRTSGYLSSMRFSLTMCIDVTNEAIGKLGSTPLAELEAQEAKSVVAESPLQIFDAMKFHPKVIAVSKSLFEKGFYAQAIFDAFKAVNNFVKEKSGLSPQELRKLKDSQLMAKVFDVNNPIIKINELLSDTDISEQEGFKFLFMGATMGIRNPKAHQNVIQEDPFITLEYLGFASFLIKRIEGWKVD